MKNQFDVIVVGARVAGASTAFLLARQGLRVVVLERSGYGADTMSTHAFMRGGVLQLRRWGLLDAVIAAGTPPIHSVSFLMDGEPLDVTIKPSYGVDALYAPRRTVLDPILVDAARAAGAEVRYGVSVVDVVRATPTGRVTGVRTIDRSGREGVVEAAIVIGADGRRSTIADLVGAPPETVGVGATSVVYGHFRGLDTQGYEWIHQPDACAGAIPTNDDLTCVFTAATPARIGRGGRVALSSILAEAAPGLLARLRGADVQGGLRFHRAAPAVIRRSWGDGWALVGDSGHWKDPIGAHGMTDALRDAELLARAVPLSLTSGDSGALAAYQQTRDRLSREVFEVTDRIARQDWQIGEASKLIRQLNSAVAIEVEELAALDDNQAA